MVALKFVYPCKIGSLYSPFTSFLSDGYNGIDLSGPTVLRRNRRYFNARQLNQLLESSFDAAYQNAQRSDTLQRYNGKTYKRSNVTAGDSRTNVSRWHKIS